MASVGSTERIPALDFSKGALVLIMVLYHWLNYFVSSEGFFYKYLRFLPPSFIFITGFLISQVYFSKYRITDRRLPGRLLLRGVKILGIFVLLNVGISLLAPNPSSGKSFLGNLSAESLIAIYLTGNFGAGKAAAFWVLVPISWLLILAACLAIASRFYRYVFQVACLGFLAFIILLDLNSLKSGNLELLTIGLLGACAGYVPIHKINNLLAHPYRLGLAYLCYILAITVWEVSFPLQIVGVFLSLALIYLVGKSSGESGRMQRSVIRLGKYSLFGYIAQIAILQLLHRSRLSENRAPWALGMSLVVAGALTILAVEVLDRARARATIVNRLYAAVFS